MRYHITSAARPKSVARDLKDELAALGLARGYATCLDLVSRMYGYRNWQDCSALIGSVAASPDDLSLDAETVEARLGQHAGVLIEAGVPAHEARALAWRLRPTARSHRDEPAPDALIAGPIQTPEGVRQALEQAALYLARTAKDLVIERYTRRHDWHLITWTPPTPRHGLARASRERHAIAIRLDGKRLVAGTTRSHYAHEIMSDLKEIPENGEIDNLSTPLAEIGYPGLMLR